MAGAAQVTVVIPTLDEESTLEGCLESVGDSSEAEVVVSDGGSRDRTLAIATARGGARTVRGSAGRGPQLNRGAAVGSAPALLFLHADCRLPEGWLPAVVGALADPATSLVCFRLRTEPVPGTPATFLGRGWLRLLDLRSRLPLLPYGDQGHAVRRADFESLGGFPEIPLMEDFAFARTCRERGRIDRLPLEIRTSARRFRKRPVRARLMTATFPWLFRAGVSPERLAAWYRDVR